jgi:hypothetical protein
MIHIEYLLLTEENCRCKNVILSTTSWLNRLLSTNVNFQYVELDWEKREFLIRDAVLGHDLLFKKDSYHFKTEYLIHTKYFLIWVNQELNMSLISISTLSSVSSWVSY